LDDLDRKILETLQRDGRIDNSALAGHVGLSASACLRRIRVLKEKIGVIDRFTVILNKEKLGLGIVVLVHVVMSQTNRSALEAFERRVRELPNVVRCIRLLGDIDYELEVVAKDLKEYDHIYLQELINLPGLDTAHSRVVMSAVKENSQVPIPGSVIEGN